MKEISEHKIIDILKNNFIDAAATLPCDRIKALLPMVNRSIDTIPLTREENGVGICAGMYMGGMRPVMIIQSTGIGNMLNALESLNLTYGIPLPVIASWRGVYKEPIEAQKALGMRLPALLEAAGISFSKIESKGELDKIDLAIKDAFENSRPHIALVSPAVWDSCEVPQAQEMSPRAVEIKLSSQIRRPVLTRYEAIEILASIADDEIIVSNLGIPSKELYEIRDRGLNFYMLGSMGLASSTGLGLAMAQRRHVYVIDGDGSLLMNPNALVGIGACNPGNLSVLAVDNAAYGSTGNQETATSKQVDLEFLAKASGIEDTAKAHTEEELVAALRRKTSFIHVIARPLNAACREIPLSAGEIKRRFMEAVAK